MRGTLHHSQRKNAKHIGQTPSEERQAALAPNHSRSNGAASLSFSKREQAGFNANIYFCPSRRHPLTSAHGIRLHQERHKDTGVTLFNVKKGSWFDGENITQRRQNEYITIHSPETYSIQYYRTLVEDILLKRMLTLTREMRGMGRPSANAASPFLKCIFGNKSNINHHHHALAALHVAAIHCR